MDVFKIVAFSIVAVLLITILKSVKKDDFALVATIIASLILFAFVLLKLESITELLTDLVEKSGINKDYLTLLLKVTGISYIMELATNICKDAANNAVASKVEMLGKISIVVLTIPILTSVISTVLEIL
ncbi:MAG: stage III sporulation protein AD [Clostridia bacterium]|nr:stage III sporulation protein AD [Clostridia bacterium]